MRQASSFKVGLASTFSQLERHADLGALEEILAVERVRDVVHGQPVEQHVEVVAGVGQHADVARRDVLVGDQPLDLGDDRLRLGDLARQCQNCTLPGFSTAAVSSLGTRRSSSIGASTVRAALTIAGAER